MGVLTADMRRVVDEQQLAFVATVCADGTPNLSPKGTIAVWDDDHLAFADICSPGTIANLIRNGSVEINIVDATLRKGYRFKGMAQVLSEGELHKKLAGFYTERGTKSTIQHIVLIRVESAAKLISPAYDNGASEREVSGRWETRWRALWDKRRQASSN